MSESLSPPPEEHELEIHDDTHMDDDDDGISTDTSGSLPGSPGADEDGDTVTICRWDGCDQDLRTLDALVRHVHDCMRLPFLLPFTPVSNLFLLVHIGTRRPRYTCEWEDCPRRGITQTSRFALVAHLRSHTGEKPFYCNVPGSFDLHMPFAHVLLECDKSFTRSDALAKHMRTVHEIETGKPQEAPTKIQIMQDHKGKRRRSPSYPENGQGDEHDLDQRSDGDDPELALYSTANRYRYLKRKLRWATERNSSLRSALQDAEDSQWRNWVKKEQLLDRVLAKENIDLGYQAD